VPHRLKKHILYNEQFERNLIKFDLYAVTPKGRVSLPLVSVPTYGQMRHVIFIKAL
jgi:hypothetical protein